MATNETESEPLLFHIKRTIIDLAEDKSGATRTTDILATYTDLAAAKAFAFKALASEGYVDSDFDIVETKTANSDWTHGDGVLVFARAPAGQEFAVAVDTTDNEASLKGDASGKVEGVLHYVLQTTINYNVDRTGNSQSTEVAGTYTTRKAAFVAAKTTLLDDEVTKESFAEYDERDETAERGEWPYGDECFVHAVGATGENILVLVKAGLKPKHVA